LGLKNFLNELTILHTNDLHNAIEASNLGKRSGYGGLRNIESALASTVPGALLFDAGDFLDQSANYAQHQKMIYYMNGLGYNAAAIGNHELANGQEYLSSLLPAMKFSLINCNFDFDNAYLKKSVKPFIVIKSGRFKIGVTGVGTNKNNGSELVSARQPYESANAVAQMLKRDFNCDFVICISHLGYNTKIGDFSNVEFAQESESIDLIISGHGDAVSPELRLVRNKRKEEVMVSHAAPEGILVKQITIGFNDQQVKNKIAYRNIVPGADRTVSAYQEVKRITA
jgi:5'-nucleotidase